MGIWKMLKLTRAPYAFVLLVIYFKHAVSSKDLILYKCPSFTSSSVDTLWSAPEQLMTDFSNDTIFRLEHLRTMENSLEYRDENIEISLGGLPIADIVAVTTTTEEELQTSTLSSADSIKFQNVNGVEYNPPGNVTYAVSKKQKVPFPIPAGQFTPTGYFIAAREYFRPDEFCIEKISEEQIAVKIKTITCNNEKTPCIPICCPIDQVINFTPAKSKCTPSGPRTYSPTFYEDPYNRISLEKESLIQPHFIWSPPQCQFPSTLSPLPFRQIHGVHKSPVRILKNGKPMYLGNDRKWKDLDQDFCLSGIIDLDEDPFYSGRESDQIMLYCLEDHAFDSREITAPAFYIPIFFISAFFLLVTALVYIVLWEKQNVHGWTVLSLVLSMFFMYIFLAWSHLLGRSHHNWEFQETFLCSSIGAIAHFFFLSTFFWLTVINFDLWWTFKSMAPMSGRSKGTKRFICYSIFAWGLPFLIITAGIILLQLFPDPESEIIVPDYGRDECFLAKYAKGVYLHYIIGVLMGWNLVFMVLTLFTIYKFKEGTRAVDAARSNNSQNLSARLFMKLFIVMGVTWIFEMVGWWQSTEDTLWYWLILDMFNISQSVGIFLIFVCKRKMLNQLEHKYPCLKVITSPLKKVTVSRRFTRTITTTTTGPGSTRTIGFSQKERAERKSQNIIPTTKL